MSQSTEEGKPGAPSPSILTSRESASVAARLVQDDRALAAEFSTEKEYEPDDSLALMLSALGTSYEEVMAAGGPEPDPFDPERP